MSNSKPAKHSYALAYLRQLCCLGLNKEVVIPEFLRAVRAVIPSDNNVFSGFDEEFNLCYHLLGFTPPDVENIPIEALSEFFNAEFIKQSTAWFNRYSVMSDPLLWDRSFYLTDAYNLVWRAFDQHHFIYTQINQSGKPAGILGLFRPRQHQPFNNHEQALLSHLASYVSHALAEPVHQDITYSEQGSSGIMIMDANGVLMNQSREAGKLLSLACYPSFSIGAHLAKDELLAKLAQLCRNLNAIFEGEDAMAPCWSLINPCGRFVFRAYWLDKLNHEPGGFIAMTMEHQQPLALEILRALQNLPLSPMQKEVALLLVQGVSSEKIGERLHIKLTTVKDHISKLYTKLDIHHREELLPKLQKKRQDEISEQMPFF